MKKYLAKQRSNLQPRPEDQNLEAEGATDVDTREQAMDVSKWKLVQPG